MTFIENHIGPYPGPAEVPSNEPRQQVHGGFGYVEESAVPRFYRDAKILTTGEGTSEILRYVIARQLGLTE